MAIFVIIAAIWVWALWVTVKYWAILPSWAQILAIVGLMPSGIGPIFTLVAVYIGKETNACKLLIFILI